MENSSDNFIEECLHSWEEMGSGVVRQIAGYDSNIMLVKVKFISGGIGAMHHHFHSQSSFVASGKFEVSIKGETKILHGGDSFYVEPDAPHGVFCLEEGLLIDAFSPAREDFL
jgi:quercetin dioxygenase-like cupin family protein